MVNIPKLSIPIALRVLNILPQHWEAFSRVRRPSRPAYLYFHLVRAIAMGVLWPKHDCNANALCSVVDIENVT